MFPQPSKEQLSALAYYLGKLLLVKLPSTTAELWEYDHFLHTVARVSYPAMLEHKAVKPTKTGIAFDYAGALRDEYERQIAGTRCWHTLNFVGKIAMDIVESDNVEVVRLSIEIEDTLNTMRDRLAAACLPVDLMDGFKKVHRHIFENPNQVMFLTREQIRTYVNAGELCCGEVIKTSKTRASGVKKLTNEAMISMFAAPAASTASTADQGIQSTKTLAELLAEKKASRAAKGS